MTGELDLAAKLLLHADPDAIARFLLGTEVLRVDVDDSELASRPIRTDKLLRVALRGQREPVWLHVEVQATWRPDVPRRTFHYWSAAHRRMPHVVSVVVCLRPVPRRGRVRSEYVVRVRGRVVLAFGFDVVELWKVPSSRLRAPGLLPLLPFAFDADPMLVERGLRLLDRVRSTRRRAELQAALVTFAGAVFPEERWAAMIPKELRMKFTIFEELEELGRLQGQRDLLTQQLRMRLGTRRSAKYLRRLKHCDDLKVLSRVATQIVRLTDDEALLAELERRLPPATRRAPTRAKRKG